MGGMVDDVTYDDVDKIFLEAYFHYIPKLWPAYLFIALFGFATLILIGQNIKYKSGYMHILVFAGLLELFGYYTRIVTIQDLTEAPFICSVLFLLLSPIFMALINYIVVGNLMAAAGIDWCCIKAKSLFKVFLASDVVCLFVQGAGGGILGGAKTQAQVDFGQDVILAGLAIQLFFFTIFNYLGFNIAFNSKHRMWDNEKLKTPFLCLISTNVLLYIRNFYRVIEFGSGSNGYIAKHEWIFYVFESCAMFICFCIYIVFHFDRILPAEEIKEIEESAGSARAESEKKAALEMKQIQVVPGSDGYDGVPTSAIDEV